MSSTLFGWTTVYLKTFEEAVEQKGHPANFTDNINSPHFVRKWEGTNCPGKKIGKHNLNLNLWR